MEVYLKENPKYRAKNNTKVITRGIVGELSENLLLFSMFISSLPLIVAPVSKFLPAWTSGI